MNSYLQTLKILQSDSFLSDVLHQASKYQNYQDYLHRRSKLNHVVSQPYLKETLKKSKSFEHTLNNMQLKNRQSTVYYPVQRTEIQYQDRSFVEKIPKKKKVVEYIERKQVEIIPKEIMKTDYYAVQHLKTYKKQVVPQIRVQTIQVPKVVKNVEYVPVQKQVIFYPNHLTDLKQIKEQAKICLQKQGVVIKEDAQYKPLSTRINSVEVNNSILTEQLRIKIQQNQKQLEKLQKQYQKGIDRDLDSPLHFIERPTTNMRKLRVNRSLDSHRSKFEGSIPTYYKQKYQNLADLSRNSVSNSSFKPKIDSSFVQKDLYRYNQVVNSSTRARY